jgi:hypothetical protein
MKKSLLIALGLAMTSASVFAQPATTAKAFRMYNTSTSSVTITASGAVGTGTFTWPQPTTGIFKSDATGIMSISAVNLGSADVIGTLPVGNGGTGLSSIPANNLLIGSGGSTLNLLAPVANKMLATDGTGNIGWAAFPPPGFTVPFSAITTGVNAGATMTVNNTSSIVLGTAGAIIESNVFKAGGSTNAVDLASSEVAGTLPLANGGTNQTGAAVAGAVIYSDANSYEYTAVGSANQVLISNGTSAPSWTNVNSVITGSALTKTDDANVTLTLGGTPGTALLQSTSLTLGWTGQLSIARGGTNSTAAPTAGAVAYGTGSAYGFTAAGSSGQFLQSTGGGAPVWATGSIAGAKGTVVGSGTYTYTVNPGLGSLAGRQIVITFENAGAGGLQTTYSVYTTGAPANSFVVEFANNITASEKFHWVVF